MTTDKQAIDNGGPAFPTLEEHGFNSGMPGMTLRDYFAAKAMQGFFASGNLLEDVKESKISAAAYIVADAMLEARKGGAA